ncbi:DnaB-like helicase C-terminal domain-containing protein [Bifidobacterium moukalabense]|uniref:DnaB-like helicase C-terminal domain-containing protein n=1 Tax=Bifidobacterium moukalabense TaxID=1333651 RepID=UPI0010F506E3
MPYILQPCDPFIFFPRWKDHKVAILCRRISDVRLLTALTWLNAPNRTYLPGVGVSRILKQLSKLARDLDVAVVLTDLATRGPIRKPGLRNLINDEAECRYADTILFIHRPEFNSLGGGDANEAELIVVKHPWIQPCTFKLRFQPEYSRFTNL